MAKAQQQQQRLTSSNSTHAKESDEENHRKRADHKSPGHTSNEDEVHKSVTENNNDHDNQDHPNPIKNQGGELESAKAAMGEVMEENQRLKQYLDRMMKDYEALQMKFYEITQKEPKKPNKTDTITTPPLPSPQATRDDEDEAELVSLSLGRSSSLDSKKNPSKLTIDGKLMVLNKERGEVAEGLRGRSLTLGLDCKFEASRTASSPENSFEEAKERESDEKEAWTPGAPPKRGGGGEDEVVQQPPVKKARVSVRVRCDTPTMNDGCQWRKYGQKIAKGNPCPRAYYRCTVAPSCPVRKQVQRCVEDMSILITTYEGTHNHPLPISATAMASTTSAAAYMLTSGSSTSTSQGTNNPNTTTIGTEPHGLSFNLPDNSKLKPFYLPNSSSTFAPTPTHPTITLDLTSTPSSSTSQFNRSSPSFLPRYASTNLNFTSTLSANNNNPSISWPNGLSSYASQANNKTQVSPLDFGSSRNPSHVDSGSWFNFQSFLQKGNPNNNIPSSISQPLPDPIAQAAKVLTSDPSFQSVLTAALSSFISGNNGNANAGINNLAENNNNNNNDEFAQKIKWGGVQISSNVSPTSQSASKGTNGCGSSLLSMVPTTTSNSQPAGGSLAFLSPPLPLSGSNKSASTSPGDSRDNGN